MLNVPKEHLITRNTIFNNRIVEKVFLMSGLFIQIQVNFRSFTWIDKRRSLYSYPTMPENDMQNDDQNN